MTYLKLLGFTFAALLPSLYLSAYIIERALGLRNEWGWLLGLCFFIAFMIGVLITWRYPIWALLKLLNEIAKPNWGNLAQ